MLDPFNYHRRATTPVHVGTVVIGGDSPVCIQSMTTTATCDIAASVAQAERIADAGGALVRLTTQGVREAESLRDIAARMRSDGYATPLVADVHFNARVADVAALYADKVRINPGNYVDPARTFRRLEYSDAEYAAEVAKIRERLLPFIATCRAHATAVRIGVNHGSLSDRIMSRYGDTPEGIVESCMEFLRVFRSEHFDDVVISIKASNTVVMVRSVRLLVYRMEREDMHYPLHLGVTEAGEGEDGRIKSAVGIGALLADGIGDTIRVSLSEPPEAEIPVAARLVSHVCEQPAAAVTAATVAATVPDHGYLQPERRRTRRVDVVGGDRVPAVVVAVRGRERPSFGVDREPDYLYVGDDDALIGDTSRRYIMAASAVRRLVGERGTPPKHVFPLYRDDETDLLMSDTAAARFLLLTPTSPLDRCVAALRRCGPTVVVYRADAYHRTQQGRRIAHRLACEGLDNPIVLLHTYSCADIDAFRIDAAADAGALMIDGLVDGLWLDGGDGGITATDCAHTAFAILQAARLRTTRTEYISCPGCGRTLYDLRTTIARIKAATAQMKGLKIAVMGCIVNGPGEMADADYGYVGAGPGRVSLYRRKECIERAIPESDAVDRLLALIKSDGDARNKIE